MNGLSCSIERDDDGESNGDLSGGQDAMENVQVWQDLAQALFNLKEFIYVR